MRVPLKWLRDYVEVTRPVKEVAHLLTMAGLEVTSIETTGADWKRVVVGHVLEVNPHPNADRLRLVKVETGSETFEVVCGAPNVAAGQRIAYASLGAELIDGRSGGKMTLEKAKIRGVVSEGMVCSERELGLSDEHEGILVLAEDAPVGRPLAEVLGDTVLVIDMKPNRADGLSVLGVARDVAALTGTSWKDPSFEVEARGASIEGRASAEIEDPDLCARFTLALIEDITIGPSPSWIQERLLAAGMRPISNVVDITNYVMLELGQPIHAFDYDKVEDHRIIVRRAKAGEKLVTLDGKERSFGEDQLLITDPSGPIAVAGVMGGLTTEVTDETKNILLEVANFDAVSIRRTAMALKLPSEASKRFAWGIAPELAPLASRRVTQFLVELASGRAAKGLVDTYPRKPEPVTIELSPRRVPQVLGIDPPRETVVGSLTALGFQVDETPGGSLKVQPPYWRQDVQYQDDLVEEVARMVGYEKVPAQPLEGAVPPRVRQPLRELRESVRDTLVGLGMQEIITYPLTSLEVLGRVVPPERFEKHPPLSVVNPLNVGQECMRTTLRASALEIVARNQKLTREHLALFECARVYEPTEKGLPSEKEHVVGAVCGARLDRFGTATEEHLDFYDAKAYLEALFERLGIEVAYRDTEQYGMLSGRTASIASAKDGKELAVLGQVHPTTAASFGIDTDVFLFELPLEAVLGSVGQTSYEAFSRYPAVVEDLAVVVARGQRAGELLADIEDHPLVAAARIFDQYEGEQVEAGKKSIAFAVSYQAPDRTLTDKDVKKAREKILARLRGRFGAELRG